MTSALIADVVAASAFAVGGSLAAVGAIEDARTGRLRNVLTGAIAGLALVGLALPAAIAGDGLRIVGMLIGAALFSTPWFAAHVVSETGVGFGDVKLTAGLGLYLGWIDPILVPVALVVATVLFVGATMARRSAVDEPRPFGPALVAGTYVAVILGVTVLT